MDLVEYFLGQLPDRIELLRVAYTGNDRTTLTTLAHQLKGAAGGYGYPSITESAAELERSAMSEEAAAADLAENLEDVIRLCRRALEASN